MSVGVVRLHSVNMHLLPFLLLLAVEVALLLRTAYVDASKYVFENSQLQSSRCNACVSRNAYVCLVALSIVVLFQRIVASLGHSIFCLGTWRESCVRNSRHVMFFFSFTFVYYCLSRPYKRPMAMISDSDDDDGGDGGGGV